MCACLVYFIECIIFLLLESISLIHMRISLHCCYRARVDSLMSLSLVDVAHCWQDMLIRVKGINLLSDIGVNLIGLLLMGVLVVGEERAMVFKGFGLEQNGFMLEVRLTLAGWEIDHFLSSIARLCIPLLPLIALAGLCDGGSELEDI